MSKQFICYMNGVSSCGKTSIAKEFMKLIKEPTIYLSLDNIHENLCDEYSNDDWLLYKKECYGLHRSAVVWKNLGFNVLIDNVLETKHLYDDAKTILPDAVYVGVFLPLDKLLEREKQRGRNQFKLVKYQYERVHRDCEYDIKLYSDKNTPFQMADVLLKYFKGTY